MTQRPQRRRAEPHRIVLSRGRNVRTITLRPWTTRLCAGIAAVLGVWLVAATVLVVFNREISEARFLYHVEKQRAYEDRIAALRRQIDEINARQFLDQVAVETELKTIQQRQAALEQRHLTIAGVIETVRDKGVAVEPIDHAAVTGSLGSAPQAPHLSTAASGPVTGMKPHPLDGAASRRERHSDASGSSLGGIRTGLDLIADGQRALLDAVESSLDETVARLAAVPEAIGAPVPEIGGIGGPFVALRGAEEPIEAADQLARIEQAMERLDALRSHISHLPVRRPLVGALRTSSGYGTRMDPFLKRRAMHTGVDFRAAQGTPVGAVAAGRVVRAGYLGGYGKLVEIDHGNGYATRYAHLSSILVERGQQVEPGEIIGKVGSTGRSTGPHLHYETRVKGRAANPLPFIEAAKLLPEGY